MNEFLALVNGGASGLISLALCYVVLNPKIHDGIVIKLGLISMALGFGSIGLRMLDPVLMNDAIGFGRSVLLINIGVVVIILGYVTRCGRCGHALRRLTDWAELDTRPGPTE